MIGKLPGSIRLNKIKRSFVILILLLLSVSVSCTKRVAVDVPPSETIVPYAIDELSEIMSPCVVEGVAMYCVSYYLLQMFKADLDRFKKQCGVRE